MQLYLADKLRALNVEPHYFFRLAHIWKFKREVDVARDALEYRQAGIIPTYVREYVQHIQESERQNGQ